MTRDDVDQLEKALAEVVKRIRGEAEERAAKLERRLDLLERQLGVEQRLALLEQRAGIDGESIAARVMRGQPVDEREWQRVLERLPHRGLNGSH